MTHKQARLTKGFAHQQCEAFAEEFDMSIQSGVQSVTISDDTTTVEIELIEEKQEKRPIMTYIILSAMCLLYLYAGLAEINWPLIPATIMGFYLLFKIDRNGRSN